jgi:hypothetical protein
MSGGEAKPQKTLTEATWASSASYKPSLLYPFRNKFEAVEFAESPSSKWSESNRRSRLRSDDLASKVRTWDEAVKLALFGWPEGRQRLIHKIVVPRREAYDRRPKRGMDFAGYVPDVPTFLGGDPQCMVSFEPRTRVKGRTFRIAVSSQITAETSTSVVENWGAALLSIVNQLENGGDRVEVFWFSTSRPCVIWREDGHKGSPVGFSIKLKGLTESLNLDDLAFWIMHPAAQRRIQFGLKEALDIERNYSNEYGYPLKDHGMVKQLVGGKVSIFEVDQSVRSVDDAMAIILKKIEEGL